jgi:hypothetical protein
LKLRVSPFQGVKIIVLTWGLKRFEDKYEQGKGGYSMKMGQVISIVTLKDINSKNIFLSNLDSFFGVVHRC